MKCLMERIFKNRLTMYVALYITCYWKRKSTSQMRSSMFSNLIVRNIISVQNFLFSFTLFFFSFIVSLKKKWKTCKFLPSLLRICSMYNSISEFYLPSHRQKKSSISNARSITTAIRMHDYMPSCLLMLLRTYM